MTYKKMTTNTKYDIGDAVYKLASDAGGVVGIDTCTVMSILISLNTGRIQIEYQVYHSMGSSWVDEADLFSKIEQAQEKLSQLYQAVGSIGM